MRDVDGIEEAIEKLKPHLDKIEEDFNRENQRFLRLSQQSHDLMGRVLKCHLIIENYLEKYLISELGLNELSSVKLSFWQKAKLIPNQGKAASYVKLGILEINKIRNKFSHNIEAQLRESDISQISEVLRYSRPKFSGTPIDMIEAFTTVACTFLIVPTPALKKLFKEAFAHISVNIEETVEIF